MRTRERPWLLAVGLFAYLLWGGPLAVVAITLAGSIWLGAAARGGRPPFLPTAVAGLAAGAAIWWLLQPGTEAGQFVRAWTLMSTIALLGLTWAQPGAYLPRVVGAMAFAVVGTAALQALFGPTWAAVTEDVQRQLDAQWQFAIEMFGMTDERTLESGEIVVPALARLFPAALALQTVAGGALGWTLARRLFDGALGTPLGAFTAFRFSDHLVWTVIVGLMGSAFPAPDPIRAAAANVLVFGSGLYTVRGLAILTRYALASGASPLVMGVLAALCVVLTIPMVIVVVTAWLVGVIDTWVDFRARWPVAPPNAR